MKEKNTHRNEGRKRNSLKRVRIRAFVVSVSAFLLIATICLAGFWTSYTVAHHQKLAETDWNLFYNTSEAPSPDAGNLASVDVEIYARGLARKTITEPQNKYNLENTVVTGNTPFVTLLSGAKIAGSSDSVDQEVEDILRHSWISLPKGEIKKDKNTFNILLLGTDLNVSEKTDGRGRADTTMLCSLNYKTGAVKLVSFQRWITVSIPGHEAIELNRAYKYGGPDLVVSLIEHLFMVKIDGYVQVDFESFPTIVDLLGGVDIELTEKEALALNGKVFTNAWAENEVFEGWNHLTGQDALAYCRLRFIDDDWKRQERQRTTLIACKEQLNELGPIKMVKVLERILPIINTNIGVNDILKLLSHIGTFAKGSIETLQVPDRNDMDGVISCDYDYEAKKISNFLFETHYELNSPY